MTQRRALWCDNHVLLWRKEACVPSVPDASGDSSCLDEAKAFVAEEYRKPGAVFLGVVHRLDRPVSGVLCFGRTSKGAARLSEALRLGRFRKTYFGLVQGALEGEGLLEQWLRKDEQSNRVTASATECAGARPARTRWRTVAHDGGMTLLELEPITGRPHQLRVACASLGAPLLGDLKYGASRPLPDRSIGLHSSRLEVPHPTRAVRLLASSAPPPSPWWGPFADLLPPTQVEEREVAES